MMNTGMMGIVGNNLTDYEESPITDTIGSPTLDVDERERYRELFGRLGRDERRERQEVTRLVLTIRARDFDEDGLM